MTHQKPASCREASEQRTVHELLTKDSPARRTKRSAKTEFTNSAQLMRQHQVAEICACHDKHEECQATCK